VFDSLSFDISSNIAVHRIERNNIAGSEDSAAQRKGKSQKRIANPIEGPLATKKRRVESKESKKPAFCWQTLASLVSPVKSSSLCPVCNVALPADYTNQQLNEHVDACLSSIEGLSD
jgi:hypothetical protein